MSAADKSLVGREVAFLRNLADAAHERCDQVVGDAFDKAANLIEAQQAEIERRDAREERVREALFVLSDRLNRIGALNSDNVHTAYERVVAALNEGTGQ